MQRYGTAVPLSAGGSAEVYRCFDTHLRRTVALKFLRWNDPLLAERMFREARAQARIDHQGVCKVYDTGWMDGKPYIAMELVEGQDLLAASAGRSVRERLKLMIQVAEAVEAAHRKGLIHRDLKPDNILVREEAGGELRPVVVDFGLVYDLDGAAARMTRTGEPLGTPAFMAPEQAAGQLDQIDVRSDVYGLGATLYALLTGHPPFEGQGTTELLIRTLEDEPKRPRGWVPDLPPEVEQIALKCLEKERERRYQTARALAEDLASYLDGEPVQASRSGWLYPLRKRARKHRWVLASLAAVGIVTAAALVAVAHKARQSSERAHYEQRFTQISNDLDWTLRAAQMSSRHDITPSRQRIRDRIRELEAELGELGAAGRAPAHYAIGRAYAALLEDDRARRHLEIAWRLGHRTPEVGYFLGLVLGRQYENALGRVRHINEAEIRKTYLHELATDYRDPAKAYLEKGREAEAVSVEYVEALIDFYEERYQPALDKLAAVRRRLPWLYEASIAEGKVLQKMGDDHFLESELEAAIELYGRAETSFRRAIASAASDPRVYPELCRLLSIKLEAELDWSVPPTAQALEDQLEVCARGLEVDPSSDRAHRAAALAHNLTARFWIDRSFDPERSSRAAEEAVRLAERAVDLGPRGAENHETLADVRMTRGRLQSLLGDGDQLPDYQAAGDSLEQAIELTAGPTDPLVVKLASNHQLMASVRIGRWQPAVSSLRTAVDLVRQSAGKSPNSFTVHCEAGNAELALAFELRRHGEPFESMLQAAEGSFERCLELNRNYHWAYIGLAEILNTRAAGSCVAGQPGVDLLRRARAHVDTVLGLDPGFENGRLRQVRFWTTEAQCGLLEGRSPRRALVAMRTLTEEARQRGRRVEDIDFLKAVATVTEMRWLFMGPLPEGSANRQRLRALYDEWRRWDPGIPDDSSITRRLYRLDHLLWRCEAAQELEGSSPDLPELDRLLARVAEVRGGELLSLPEFEVQQALLERVHRRRESGTESAAELLASRRRLRAALARRETMAPFVEPWLRRLELLSDFLDTEHLHAPVDGRATDSKSRRGPSDVAVGALQSP